MRTLVETATTTNSNCTAPAMATDVNLSHTIDDDITFERVRHMPRRTQFVSTHRKLTWQHDKVVKQYERDQRISNTEMTRARTAMAEKLTRLQDAKRQLQMQKSGDTGDNRRYSAPCLTDPELNAEREAARSKAASAFHQSHSVSSFPVVTPRPEVPAPSDRSSSQGQQSVRTVVVASMPKSVPKDSIRRATIAEGATHNKHLPPSLMRRLSLFMENTATSLNRQGVTESERKTKQQNSVEEEEDEEV